MLDAALKSGIYKVRGITRNTDNATAKALAARGVEMVAANLDDEASLVKAFEVCLLPVPYCTNPHILS